jgi:membrane protein
VAWVFLVLGGLSVAASLQGLYQRVFGLDSRTTRDVPRALTWLVLLVAWLYASGWAGPRVRAGGPAGFAAAGLVLFTLFWWVTMWLLLAGQIPWRGLLPCAVATGVCWLGMEEFFAVIFSGMVTSDDQKYGPIGTVFALMSYLIAMGVVVILGAVTGLVWQERACHSGPPSGNYGRTGTEQTRFGTATAGRPQQVSRGRVRGCQPSKPSSPCIATKYSDPCAPTAVLGTQ